MKVISSRAHTIIGLVVGIVLILAPWIFQFSNVKSAKTSAIILGAIAALSELTTTSPISPMKIIPMRAHLGMDVILGLVLGLSPWLFGFSDKSLNVWLPHLIVGILIILYALMTRTNDAIVKRPIANPARHSN